MRRKKQTRLLKYLAVAIIAASAGSFFLLRYNAASKAVLPSPVKNQAGYKAEDREKLEQLIHQGAEND